MADLAWAAGIYEGEGSIAIYGGNNLRVVVTQKDRWILDRLRDLFGGSVYAQTAKYQGKPYPIHHWYLNGARGRGLLYTMYTWLSPRRRLQARKALARVVPLQVAA